MHVRNAQHNVFFKYAIFVYGHVDIIIWLYYSHNWLDYSHNDSRNITPLLQFTKSDNANVIVTQQTQKHLYNISTASYNYTEYGVVSSVSTRSLKLSNVAPGS